MNATQNAYPASTAAAPDQPAFDCIAERVRYMANVLSSTNDSHEHTVARLFSDPAAEATGSLRAVPPQMPGQIGAVHAALDYLQHEVERASGFVSDFSRL